MLNCYCQLSSSVIFRQYGVSQSECKIDRPRPRLSRLSPRPHTKALGTRLHAMGSALRVNKQKVSSCKPTKNLYWIILFLCSQANIPHELG